MNLQAVLFDYGGTLDGEASHWLDRFVGFYRAAGIDLPFDRLKAAFYRADEAAHADPNIAQASLGDLMSFHVTVQLDTLGLDHRNLHARLVDTFVARSTDALRASRGVLETLAARCRLGVVSNFYGNVARILADAGIAPLLTVVVDSTVVGMAKPDPRIFAHAVAAVGIPATQTLHVGDSYDRDVCPAHAAGLRTAWLTRDGSRGPAPGDYLPDLQIASLPSLVTTLEGCGWIASGRP